MRGNNISERYLNVNGFFFADFLYLVFCCLIVVKISLSGKHDRNDTEENKIDIVQWPNDG